MLAGISQHEDSVFDFDLITVCFQEFFVPGAFLKTWFSIRFSFRGSSLGISGTFHEMLVDDT